MYEKVYKKIYLKLLKLIHDCLICYTKILQFFTTCVKVFKYFRMSSFFKVMKLMMALIHFTLFTVFYFFFLPFFF